MAKIRGEEEENYCFSGFSIEMKKDCFFHQEKDDKTKINKTKKS